MNPRANLISLVESLGSAKILCVGDVILDHFHYGSVGRISPEAPIPVLKLEREATMLGGAGNVVRNLVGLGASVRFITVIGRDNNGGEVERLIAEEGITDLPLVDDGGRRTSAKSRYLAGTQQMLRTDQETVFPLSDEMEAKLLAAAKQALSDCDAVILSDYAKGVLTENATQQLIKAAKEDTKTVIVDPKGTDYSRYRGADVITPNQHELAEATSMATGSDEEVTLAAQSLIDQYDFGAVLATRSKDGMALLCRDGSLYHLKTEARDVFDVSGAGDTVVATLSAALGAGGELEDAATLANIAAGIVVGKVGTAVAFAADVIAGLHHQDRDNAEAKVMALKPALEQIDRWRRSGLTVGFTNGCFDLLHPGHISLLSQAREASGKLIVGLNSDTSVKLLKGEGRPIQTEAARAAVLASLASVDLVIIFSEQTPLKLIEELRPDVLIKGADYSVDKVVGADIVKSYGGRIVLAELAPGHSTTNTIAKLTADKT
ncbi:MAG: D-glycero-beta-D-manno-heptose-7-phosphate kinase [Rhodospirillales bacterium]|nr:D-glycero-beta-D-manno-heptose-7-phosphate kinase [Rhodospirillales bacterium]